VKITYISNEGFMIEYNNKCILVDAIHRGEYPPYDLISAEILKKMQNASPPFDKVDLILVTHHHYDHYDPYSTILHLKNNPKAILISTDYVISSLEEHFQEVYLDIEDQIRSYSIEPDSKISLEFNGIKLRILGLPHAEYLVKNEETGKYYNIHETVQHLAFLVEIAEKKILHIGDAVPKTGRRYSQLYDEIASERIVRAN